MNQQASGPAGIQARWSRYLHTYGLATILVVFVALGLLYDLTVPFFEKPDELKHFAVIQHIQSRGRLPVVQAGVARAWDQEGTQPPLYHLLAAGAVSWLDLNNFEELPRNPHYVDDRSFIWRERGNNNLYLHAPGEAWSSAPVFLAARLARWLSLLAGLATVFLTYRLARLVFEPAPVLIGETSPPANHQLSLLAAALVAFIPQFLHVSSAISNDGLSVTVAAAVLLLLVLIIRQGSSLRAVAALGLALGLGAITKLSLLYLAPLAGLALLFDLRRHRSPGRLLFYGAVLAGLMLLVAGWWYWRNWQLYGDITALNAHLLYRGGPLDPRPTLGQLWQTELTGLELSFWAAFGAGQVLLEPWLYTVLGWVKYLVLLGVAAGVWRYRKRGEVDRLPALGLLALWALIIFAALLRWMQITPASWGRLLYPALPALGVLAAWGLAQLGPALFVADPPQARMERSAARSSLHYVSRFAPAINTRLNPLALPLFLAAALFILSLVSPFRYLQAAYAKTPLITEADLPPDVDRLDLTYNGDLRLIGYRLERAPGLPGEWLPVTLYWQAVRPVARNYSTFIHLLGQDQAVVGQTNTYPDGGKWPTSLLPPGLVLPATYHVPVSLDAEAPAVVRLAIGIFEFEDPARTAKPALNPAGQVVEPIVGELPLLPHRWPAPNPLYPAEVDFAGQIKLAGYDAPANLDLKPGARLPLTLYWQPLAAPGRDLTLFIHLVETATGEQVRGFDAPPAFPTGYWQPGYVISDVRDLSLPADLPPGSYTLRLGWYSPDTLARLPLANGADDAWPLLEFIVK